jgi:hypothetical protein
MSKPESSSEREKRLREARARRDELKRSLLAMNGGNPDLYAGMGRNEGYDSTLCALRSEQALVDELSDGQAGDSQT